MEKSTHSIIRRIAFIGNYMPRQCGIATFTTDLCEAIADEYKGTASTPQAPSHADRRELAAPSQ